MLLLPPLSLYVHIPWCVQKCPYCDFNSHRLKQDLPHEAYVNHLLIDLQQTLTAFPTLSQRTIETIFIGGGTPSLLSGTAMQKLIHGIKQLVTIHPNAEITMEANPGTVDSERFYDYKQAGITRLSMGIQSFNDCQLQKLGRIHSGQEAISAFQFAKSLQFESINLDLMHGLPQQTAENALLDLEQAIALQPTHLSWYQLTIEPNTLFGSRPPILPDDDELWHIYQSGHQRLMQAGYQQYETSAYAKTGFQCQHNKNYWRFGDYIGLGCGAHGKLTFVDGKITRTIKVKHPNGYLQGQYLDQQYQVAEAERPFEFFMNRFRLFEPTPRHEFCAYTGINECDIRPIIEQAIQQSYLIETPTDWQVTEHGKLFLNTLLELFLTD